MLTVEHFITSDRLAKGMEHFSDAAAKQFGRDLMYELCGRWTAPKLRIFLGAMEDELRAAEREARIPQPRTLQQMLRDDDLEDNG